VLTWHRPVAGQLGDPIVVLVLAGRALTAR
jgi:hypothetical protein